MINNNFKLIWFGKLISQLGDKFYAIALAWWILQNTHSTVIMGFFMLTTAIPAIGIGLFTGALTDRWNRKRMLVITDIVRGVLVLAIALLAAFGVLEIWQVFVIGALLSAATSFFEPAIQAIVPDLVESSDLKKANGMSQMVGGVCQIAGPLCGALAVSLIGMTTVFFVNSASYFIAAVLSALLTWRKSELALDKKDSTVIQDIKEGLRYVRGQKRIITILVIIGAAHFFVGSLFVALPFLANRLSGKGVNNLGYLEMLMGVGLIAGSLLNGLKKNNVTDEEVLMKLIMGFGAAFLCLGLAQWRGCGNVLVYLPILLIIGVIIANASIFWQLLLQLSITEQMKGRVFGISSLIGNISMPIAFGVVGILLDFYSIYLIMLVSGICLISLGLILLAGRKKEIIVKK